MASSITINIPNDADLPTIKAAIEKYALEHSGMSEGQTTFTNQQALIYTKTLLIDRIKELVIAYKQSNIESTARAQATTETNTIVLN